MAAVTTAVVGAAAVANTAYQGKKGREAAKRASQQQADAARESAEMTQEAQAQLREDLSPFREVGLSALPILEGMATADPVDRVAQLEANPLFQAALNARNRDTLGAAATQGRIGTGDVSQQFSENFLISASPLIQQQMEEERLREQRLLNLVNIAQPSAAQTAASGVNAARAAGLDFQSAADATSAGVVASQQAQAQQNAQILEQLPALIGAVDNARTN